MAGDAMKHRHSHIIVPVCGMLSVAMAHSVLPVGMFRAYDTALRMSVVGMIASTAALLSMIIIRKS